MSSTNQDEETDVGDESSDDEWLDLPEVLDDPSMDGLKFISARDAERSFEKNSISPEMLSLPIEMVALKTFSDRIFLGNVAASLSPFLLHHHSITHILTIMDDAPDLPKAIPCERKVYPRIDSERETILFDFLPACRWIDQILASSPKNSVLVHCFMGISRSASFVLAYWMWHNRTSKQRSLRYWMQELRKQRKCIRPNPGFVQQLEDFQFWLRCPTNIIHIIFLYSN